LHHALSYFLSILAHCGKRCITRGGAAGEAFEEFPEADAFDCFYQTTHLSKVIWKRWEIWGVCSKITREMLQRCSQLSGTRLQKNHPCRQKVGERDLSVPSCAFQVIA
jgi:hypothetical protein